MCLLFPTCHTNTWYIITSLHTFRAIIIAFSILVFIQEYANIICEYTTSIAETLNVNVPPSTQDTVQGEDGMVGG